MYYKRISDLKPLVKLNGETIGINTETADDDERKLLKSLWVEVAIAKDKNGNPTGDKKQIDSFDHKRLNIYKLRSVAQGYGSSSTANTVTSADRLNTEVLKITNGFINLGTNLTVNNLITKAIDSNEFNTSSLSIQSITSNTINFNSEHCNITHITGNATQFGFSEFDFENVVADSISAVFGKIDDTLYTDEIYAEKIFQKEMVVNTLEYKTAVAKKSINCEYDNMVEYFVSNGTVPSNENGIGTLIRFGNSSESHADWDIKIAEHGTNKIVNGIIGNAKTAGVVFDDGLDGVVLPVVLLGKTLVKIQGTVAKFDKLYLSKTTDGVACNIPNGQSIGIALQASSDAQDGRIECFTKFNVQ